MGAIYFLSDQPKAGIPSFGIWDWLIKKGSHFLAYGVLAWLAWRVFEAGKRPYLAAFLLTVLYAASDEFHQTFVPGRHGTVDDVLIDSLGGLTTLFILRKNWLRFFGFRHQSNQSR
jgi:VanZ family protein